MWTYELSPRHFQQLKDMQVRLRMDWPAVFSCNANRETWAFTTLGYTPHPERIRVEGQSDVLDDIVEMVLDERPVGGRFFINETGVFAKPDGDPVQLVQFDFPKKRTRG